MVIYLRLFLVALVPAFVSAIFYLLTKKTAFGRLPEPVAHLIIGVVFGGVAILGTEFGVDVGGAVANARDAAPLCAGLLFGGPAGIIAGVIGGVERWIAVAWGAGMYSRTACTVSTILSGLYAAFLRRYLFEKKRPGWGMAFATGVVMEVIHLTILLVTHLDDTAQAFAILKICTLPMILCNAVSVALAVVLIELLSHSLREGDKKIRKISQKIQLWLLVTVAAAYIVTTLFVYALQGGTAIKQAETLTSINLEDLTAEIQAASDSSLLDISHAIAKDLERTSTLNPESLAVKYKVTEVNIVDNAGVIIRSNNPEFIGFDMNSGEQAKAFMVLTQGIDELVQPFSSITYSADESYFRKYAGVALSYGGFVQVGYNAERFQEDLNDYMLDLTENRHVGETGYSLIADHDFILISDRADHNGRNLDTAGIWIDLSKNGEMKLNKDVVYGEPCFWMYKQAEGYYIVSVLPQAEAYSGRDAGLYVNSFMEVLVFAVLFLLIYLLIKRQVVDNIHSVNKSLDKICSGDLSVNVDVRDSREFASLSDDINATVSVLKRYISEAEEKINEELEFAQKIQLATLPSTFPAFPSRQEIDIYASTDTAKEVGGDFYDFYMLGENWLSFLVADVSGKGIPAAMFMMTAKTILQSLAETGLLVHDVLTRANEKLCEENDAGMFVTVWMGVLDLRNGHVIFANAGHNPPLLSSGEKGFCYLKSRPGLVLAGMEGFQYRMHEFDMQPGDKIFLYTDGVTEAVNPGLELYGEERLLAFLNERLEADAKTTIQAVRADIDAFAGEAEQFDDITMLMLEYKGRQDNMIEKIFPAVDGALSDVTAFIEEELGKLSCSPKIIMQIDVALEELFVNVAHYAYPNFTGTVKVAIGSQEDEIHIRLNDSGIPFNPLEREDPDVTASAEERGIGGLGIYMVKKSMDKVHYEYKDGQNVLTIIKKYK